MKSLALVICFALLASGQDLGIKYLFVASGHEKGGPARDVEIIPLDVPHGVKVSCVHPHSLTLAEVGLVGGFVQDRIHVCGGDDEQGTIHNDCFLWDPTANEWLSTFAMTKPRYQASALTLNDLEMLVVGGINPVGIDNSAEIFEAGIGFNPLTVLPMPFAYDCLARKDENTVVLVGGGSDNSTYGVYELSLDTATVSFVSSPPGPTRNGMMCGIVNSPIAGQELIIAGGFQPDADLPLWDVQILSYADGVWRVGPTLPSVNHLAQSVAFGDTMLIVGGNSATTLGEYDVLKEILQYDALLGTWRTRPETLKKARSSFTAFLVPDIALNCTVH